MNLLEFFGIRGDAHTDVVRQLESGEWIVISESGKQLGLYKTEKEANERLRQIIAAGAAKSKDSRDSRDSHWVSRVDYLGDIVYVQDAPNASDVPDGSFAAKSTLEGYLKISGTISGCGVYMYSDGEETWGELRTPEEVFHPDSLASFEMCPICDDHPSEMVTAQNIGELQKGNLGSDIRPADDGDHVLADMLITDPVLIEKIKQGKTQLSNGYEALIEDESGVADDGTPYEGIQTRIRGNHTAVVDRARGGPTCRLMFDAVGINTPIEDTMKLKKKKDGTITIEGTEYTVPDEVAAYVQGMMVEAAAEAGDQEEDPKPEDPKPEGEGDMKGMKMSEEDMKGMKMNSAFTVEALRAQVDSMQTQLRAQMDSASATIDARVNLLVAARDVLGEAVKTDGVSDLGLMRAVVAKVTPAMKAKTDKGSVDYVTAAYEMALDSFKSRVDSSTDLLTLTHDAIAAPDEGDDLDALFKAHCDGLRSRSMSQKEAN